MNYRHSFHAGNFADILKHAVLLQLLALRLKQAQALSVLDTHAGSGLYDLAGEGARRSREAETGVAHLAEAQHLPPAIQPLRQAVSGLNPEGGIRHYPGSPWLIAKALRAQDRYLACELRPEEQQILAGNLAQFPRAEARLADGYEVAQGFGRAGDLALIDPPFERGDDYERAARAAAGLAQRAVVVAVWTPLKDLETFDRFLRGLRAQTRAPVLVIEARLRPLADPMRLNGATMVVLNPPRGLVEPAAQIAGFVAGRLGDEGASSEVWSLD